MIGIGQINLDPQTKIDEPKVKRIAEMKARKEILELAGEVEISVEKGSDKYSDKKMSLTSYWQTTQINVEGHIKLMPIIGTWWSKNRNKLYVALGDFQIKNDDAINLGHDSNQSVFADIKGEEPYISLLKLNPDFSKNGGVRGVMLDDNTRIIMSVASSKITSSSVKARKSARLKAIRFLLAQKEGIKVLSMERLEDKETLVLSTNGSRYELLSEFLSIQKEHISGFINALPVVATWNESGVVKVAIGSDQIADRNTENVKILKQCVASQMRI